MGPWPRAVVAAVVLVLLSLTGLPLADELPGRQRSADAGVPDSPVDGIDPYGRGDSTHVGTRSEVCVSSVPPGTGALARHLSGAPGVRSIELLSCRLIAARPGTGSRNVPPGDETRYSNWSSHASGRALDLRIGTDTAAGDRIVDHLLATHDGIPHLVARRLGVMQIIWDGGCWEAREASRATIHSAADMRAQYPCPAGASHRDHPHITLSLEGAQGRTSGYPMLGPTAFQLPPEFYEPGPNRYERAEG